MWRRIDPIGPNTLAFLRACLAKQPGRWEDISDALALSTGQFKVFRRAGA